jgi:uncharacterized oligopeptide transporter (OPT) family protein
VGLGAVLGLAVLAADFTLEKRGMGVRLHLMPIAVGLYLPFGLAVPIFAGGLIEWWGRRGRVGPQRGPAQRGVLFSSGVVAGEALVGVGIALLVGLGYSALHLDFAWTGALSLAAALLVVWIFQRGTRSDPSA